MKRYRVRWYEVFEREVEAECLEAAQLAAVEGADYPKDYVLGSTTYILTEEID